MRMRSKQSALCHAHPSLVIYFSEIRNSDNDLHVGRAYNKKMHMRSNNVFVLCASLPLTLVLLEKIIDLKLAAPFLANLIRKILILLKLCSWCILCRAFF
jgi:hypothetical protein